MEVVEETEARDIPTRYKSKNHNHEVKNLTGNSSNQMGLTLCLPCLSRADSNFQIRGPLQPELAYCYRKCICMD